MCDTVSYRDLLSISVCSVDNKECMLHECNACPGKKVVLDYLKNNKVINENRATVTFNNWTSVNTTKKDSNSSVSRAVLSSFTAPIDKFIDQLVNDLWNITEHHFVAEAQKNDLSHCKKSLKLNTCIGIMDFAENYTFICQDSIQAFYFSSTQATLHPIVIYYKTNNETEFQIMNFCVISDSLKHTAASVNIFQEKVIKKFNEECPWVTNMIYFSDGERCWLSG